MKTQIFINKFQKGSAENPNIGMGSMVGIDIYSKKGVAILAKKSTIVSTNFTGFPHFIENGSLGSNIWVQCSDGSILKSMDGGITFTDMAFPTGATGGNGNGMIGFQNYLFPFTKSEIYYTDLNSGSATATWTDWTSTKGLTPLNNQSMNPITALHFPMLYPSSRGVYFGNGASGSTSVGFFGQNGTTTFNPGGTTGTDFLYNATALNLPSLTYSIGPISFLPPQKLAISLFPYQNPSQSGDLITWDTVSANKFDPPLRIYCDTPSNTVVAAGIKQLYPKNNILYAVAGGNHSIYETSGANFNIVDDISLRSNIRAESGGETISPVYFNSYPAAINIVGNKLLTGVAPLTNTTLYPPTLRGYFPVGVWSITFNPDGSTSTQCEYPIPLGSGLTSPQGNGEYAKITCIKPISQVSNSTYKLAVGFAWASATVSPNPTYGLMMVDLYKFIDDINFTAIESELFEIGTALNPQVVNNIEVLLAKPLLSGQTIDVAYRTSLSSGTGSAGAWTTLDTFRGDGIPDNYKITKNPIGATRYLQLRVRMATGAGGVNPNDSPELRNVIIS